MAAFNFASSPAAKSVVSAIKALKRDQDKVRKSDNLLCVSVVAMAREARTVEGEDFTVVRGGKGKEDAFGKSLNGRIYAALAPEFDEANKATASRIGQLVCWIAADKSDRLAKEILSGGMGLKKAHEHANPNAAPAANAEPKAEGEKPKASVQAVAVAPAPTVAIPVGLDKDVAGALVDLIGFVEADPVEVGDALILFRNLLRDGRLADVQGALRAVVLPVPAGVEPVTAMAAAIVKATAKK